MLKSRVRTPIGRRWRAPASRERRLRSLAGYEVNYEGDAFYAFVSANTFAAVSEAMVGLRPVRSHPRRYSTGGAGLDPPSRRLDVDRVGEPVIHQKPIPEAHRRTIRPLADAATVRAVVPPATADPRLQQPRGIPPEQK